MRETYGSLILKSKNLCSDESTSSDSNLSDTATFLKKEINLSNRFIHSYISNYETQSVEKTASTVADQQFYHYPPGLGKIESVQINIGGRDYTPEIVENESTWKWINSVTFNSSTFPVYMFPRRDDFGIWPIPQDAYTITFNGNYMPKDMVNDDYITGTVVVSQNTTVVTGTDTVFTASMIGRWFKADDNGDWYRISTFTSTTVIGLESSFEGASVSGSTFIIAESPEIPMELHEYIPYKAAASWYAGPRRDVKNAQSMLNYFWTGDFTNGSRDPSFVQGGLIYYKSQIRELGRDNSQLARKVRVRNNRFDERGTILT